MADPVRRAAMIARDQRALLRRIANIYPGPGGGLDPSPGGGGYSGPGGGKYIGPSRLAKGGAADAKARFLKGSKAPLRLYHGTVEPTDFSVFGVGEPHYVEDEHGESIQRQGSGPDPTTYLGSHFAEEPEVANRFARGLYGERKGTTSGNRVYPVHLAIKNPHVTTEREMHDWMLRQSVSTPWVEHLLNDDDEMRARYEKDSGYRRHINESVLGLEHESDEPTYETAQEMARKLRDHLIAKGHDGIKYKNEVEGGTSWIAFDPRQIKSAIGNRGTYDPNDPDISKAGGGYIGRATGGNVPPFKLHSGAAKIIKTKGQAKATPQQYAAMPGIKPDELKHSKFDTLGSKALPREEVIKHLEDNAVPLQETLLRHYEGDYAPHDDVREDDGDTKFHTYQLPGGENYREVLLHLPDKQRRDYTFEWFDPATQRTKQGFDTEEAAKAAAPEGAVVSRVETATHDPIFKSSHWEEPNVLAHLRMSDRRGPNGEKVLHVEEVQSDWGQQGRDQGFKQGDPDAKLDAILQEVKRREPQLNDEDPHAWDGVWKRHPDLFAQQQEAYKEREGVPHGPYVDSTQKWTDLALKRVLHEAAHGGYDKVVVTPGDEQNKRYDLSHQVKNITYFPDIGYLHATTHDNQGVEHEDVKPGDLATHIGKEAAEKIMKYEPQRYEGRGRLGGEFYHELEGDDLKMGGAGMRGYYDNILPKRLQTLAQQHDPQAKVQLGGFTLRTPQNVEDLPEDEQADYLDRDPSGAQRQVPDARRDLHSLDITPQMRDSIKGNGFSQFKRGGEVEPKWVNPLEEGAAASGHTPASLYPRLRKRGKDTINKLSTITPNSDWENMAVLRARQPLVPHKPLDPHKMIGSTLVSGPGDLLATDMTIHGIGGNIFKNPVHTEGGPFYSRGKAGTAWASNEKAIKDQLNAALQAERQGSPAYHVPISMSRGAISSTPAVWNMLAEMLPFAKISKANAAKIDKTIRTHPHPKTGEPLFPNAPSIGHRDFPDWVAKQLNLSQRYQLMNAIEKSANVVAGLPEPGAIRMAVTEPEYLAPRSMSAGRVLSKLHPEKGLLYEPKVPHSGYPIQAPGTYHGGFERPTPVGLMFPKAWKTIAGNLDPEIDEVPNAIQRKLQLTTQMQKVTPEMADNLAAYYERMRGKPFKTGGRAGYAPGGGVNRLLQNLKGSFSNLNQQVAAQAPQQQAPQQQAPADYQGMVGQATQQDPDPAYQRMLAQALNGKSYDELFPKAATPAAAAPAASAAAAEAPPPAYPTYQPLNYSVSPTEMLGGGGGGFKRGGRTSKKSTIVERALAAVRRK